MAVTTKTGHVKASDEAGERRMTKIKNFRIHLRPREIARWMKNEYQTPITPDLEAAIEGAIARLKTKIHPAAIYTTMTRATAEKATSIAFPDKSVAVSLVAVSVGSEFSAYLQVLPLPVSTTGNTCQVRCS